MGMWLGGYDQWGCGWGIMTNEDVAGAEACAGGGGKGNYPPPPNFQEVGKGGVGLQTKAVDPDLGGKYFKIKIKIARKLVH